MLDFFFNGGLLKEAAERKKIHLKNCGVVFKEGVCMENKMNDFFVFVCWGSFFKILKRFICACAFAKENLIKKKNRRDGQENVSVERDVTKFYDS